MDEHTENAPAVEPVPEAPATPSTPSAGSEAPAAAPIVPPVGAAALVPDPVVEPVVAIEPVVEPVTERARLLGVLHHVVIDVEAFASMLETHARAAIVAGEGDVHSALSRLSTLFGDFRNGMLNAGKTLPAKLESEAAGLVAKAKA